MNKFKKVALTAVAALAVGTSVNAKVLRPVGMVGAGVAVAGVVGLVANKMVEATARKRGVKRSALQQNLQKAATVVASLAIVGGSAAVVGDVTNNARTNVQTNALANYKEANAKTNDAEKAAALKALGYENFVVLAAGLKTKDKATINLLVEHAGLAKPTTKDAEVTVTDGHIIALTAAAKRAEGIDGDKGLQKKFDDAAAAVTTALKAPEAKDGNAVTPDQTAAHTKLVAAHTKLAEEAPKAPVLAKDADATAKDQHATKMTEHNTKLAAYNTAVADARKVDANFTKLFDAKVAAKKNLDAAEARIADVFIRLAIQNARTFFGKLVDAGTFVRTVKFKKAPATTPAQS